MPSNPVTGSAMGMFTPPTYEEQREAMMRLGKQECSRCGGLGTVKVKIGWHANPKDRVGYMPPIIEYEAKPCPECGRKDQAK